MQMGQGDGVAGDINVTPMIDVLLVLMIIAMILVQLRMAFDLNVPAPDGRRTPGRVKQIVLDLPAAGGYRINGTGVTEPGLEARIHALFARRTQKILFRPRCRRAALSRRHPCDRRRSFSRSPDHRLHALRNVRLRVPLLEPAWPERRQRYDPQHERDGGCRRPREEVPDGAEQTRPLHCGPQDDHRHAHRRVLPIHVRRLLRCLLRHARPHHRHRDHQRTGGRHGERNADGR